MKTFHLTISSPDGNVFDGEIYKLDLRGVEGELAIMAGHVPFVTSIFARTSPYGVHSSSLKSSSLANSAALRRFASASSAICQSFIFVGSNFILSIISNSQPRAGEYVIG